MVNLTKHPETTVLSHVESQEAEIQHHLNTMIDDAVVDHESTIGFEY